MSNLFLNKFHNVDRMPIESSIVNDLSTGGLTTEEISRLQQSFSIDEQDDMACAASARLWENLLEKHRTPFLMLRVADMRIALEQHSTAILLYEELANILNEEDFTNWVSVIKEINDNEVKTRVKKYLASPSFSPSQRWKPTARVDPFPDYHPQRSVVDAIRKEWIALKEKNPTMQQYFNMTCIETNEVEGTVMFNSSASTKLIQVGFYNEVVPAIPDPVVGEVRDASSALSILQDTRNALRVLFAMLESGKGNFVLTLARILELHKELMRTSTVLCLTRSSGVRRLAYFSAGITRQTSQINVTARNQAGSLQIQFAPFDCVEEELEAFCERFNKIVNMHPDEMNPFSAAAWISHVFVTIHPFEDGNGRVSRLLASIPLIQNNLPPLNIPPLLKIQYIDELNNVRGNRPINYYNGLVEVFVVAVETSLRNIKTISRGTK